MNHFITDDIDRIDLGDGEWVDIKRQMNYGEQLRLASSFSATSITIRDGAPKLNALAEKADLETGSIALLFINIRAWSFKDGSGKSIPINETNIRRLDITTANKISKEISKRNPAPKV